jgi:Acetyltransferases, including N-acetylases of ribosomal proteins
MYKNQNNKGLVWPQEHHIDSSLSIAMLAVEHTEKVFALIDENREYLARWLPWVDETRCVDDTRSHILKAPVQLRQGTDVNYVIKFNHTIVGRVGFHYVEPFSGAGRLGYWLSEKSQGRGIMSRVCNYLTEEALYRQGIRRVEIRCAVENSQSRRIPERLGYRFHGFRKGAECLQGRYVDHAVYFAECNWWVTSC